MEAHKITRISIRFLAAIAALIILGVLGRLDFQAEQRDLARYCEMVAAGYWPAYEGREGCESTEAEGGH